jgi:hypothetical protein
MPIPEDWKIRTTWDNNSLLNVEDPRGLCPHCRKPSTFAIQAQVVLPTSYRAANVAIYWIHLILRCNSISCSKTSYVVISISSNLQADRAKDEFFMHPSRAIDPVHPAVPKHIANDWTEAQKAMGADAPKAAAVMCRRVLYGAILDKKCKEHPLNEGLKQLIQDQRLPAIFDDWLPAIKDDGHDAAHPHRALEISPENVSETMDYTAELLRFLYIEPYEFQERKARNAPKP